MPTAPLIAPTAACANARSSRFALRSASNANPASLIPNVVGSAWIPCVRPTHSVAYVLTRACGDCLHQAPGIRQHQLADALELQRQPGVEHVARGQPVMNPAPGRSGRLRQHVDERGDVVVGHLLALVDRVDRERGRADRVELGGRRAVHLLAGGDLDLAHRVEARLVGPDHRQLGAGVAGDHRVVFTAPRPA